MYIYNDQLGDMSILGYGGHLAFCYHVQDNIVVTCSLNTYGPCIYEAFGYI